VLEVLCDLADREPDEDIDIGNGLGSELRVRLRELWNQALEHPDPDPASWDGWPRIPPVPSLRPPTDFLK